MPELHRSTSIGAGPVRDPGGNMPPSQRWLEDEIDLGWYRDAFIRRWKLIAAAGVVGAVIGFSIASLQTVNYEGVTTLLVVPPAKSPNSEINPATFRAILVNASLAAQVLDELQLSKPPQNLTPQVFLERALNVEAPSGTNVVRVKVQLLDPRLAADASLRLARKAIALTQQLNQQEGSSVQEQLKRHLDNAAERMKTAENDLLAYQQKAQVELLREDTQAMLAERRDLLKLLVAIESEKARLGAAEAEIKRQQPVLSVSRAVGAEQALRRAQVMDQGLEPNRPKPSVPGMPADSESLDLTNPFVNPVYQTLDLQIATSRARLAALDQERRQLVEVRNIGGADLEKLKDLYSRQIELARLQTSFDLTKRVHSDLVVRYEESRTQALGNSPQLQLVDEAIPPDRPVSRRRMQWAGLGLVAAILIGALVAVNLESRRQLVRAGVP